MKYTLMHKNIPVCEIDISKFIDETRCENICYALAKRIDMLKDLC